MERYNKLFKEKKEYVLTLVNREDLANAESILKNNRIPYELDTSWTPPDNEYPAFLFRDQYMLAGAMKKFKLNKISFEDESS